MLLRTEVVLKNDSEDRKLKVFDGDYKLTLIRADHLLFNGPVKKKHGNSSFYYGICWGLSYCAVTAQSKTKQDHKFMTELMDPKRKERQLAKKLDTDTE